MEYRPVRQGSEEYLDSEKYQRRTWDLENPNSLAELLARLNKIRRANPALQHDRTLCFHESDNPTIVCYSKTYKNNAIIVAANTDPTNTQWATLDLNLPALGLTPDEPFQVHDLLSGAHYRWQGWHPVVGLDPGSNPVHLFLVRRRIRSEADFDYFI